MAFGFFKKLVEKITGKKPAPQKKDGRPQQGKQGGDAKGKGGNGRGRHGRRGRHGNGGEQQPQQQKKQGPQDQQRKQRNEQQRKPRNEQQGKRPDQQQQNQQRREERSDRGRRGDRRRDGSRRAPQSHTPADEMRPGGVVSAAEMEARKAAHAAWSIDQFKVEPAEGKKRFHDFDLPSEVMHGIADLGFKYCTEIQAMSLGYALEGKNVAGKAITGSGKTAAFLVAILTRYLRTPENRASKGGVPRALVIAPTRELVIQICKDADATGNY